jgi:hypothetical protein
VRPAVENRPEVFAAALGEFIDALPVAWQTEVRSVGPLEWRIFRRPEFELPAQGWKLHVSASALEAVELARVVLPALLEFEVLFKVPASFRDLIRINSGEVSLIEVGKVVTVYPATAETLERLVERLERLWHPAVAPAIASDVPVSVHGGLWLRYGAFDGRHEVTNALGVRHIALVSPTGDLVPDVPREDGVQPGWAPPPPVDKKSPPGPIDPAVPVRLGDSSYLRLKVLAASVGSRVDLALRLHDRRLVVIKTAVPGARCDPLGYDAVARLENELSALSALDGARCCPAVIAYDGEQHLLAIEDVEGDPFLELSDKEKLARVPRLFEAVAELHARGFVHRDLKLSNVRSNDAGVRLVDFELAAKKGTVSPIQAGTPGYLPPEGHLSAAHPSYDVYSVGACLTHICTGRCPGFLPLDHNAGRQIGLLKLSGQHAAARIVEAALGSEPQDRPSARDLGSRAVESMPLLRAESHAGRDQVSLDGDRRWSKVAAVDAGRSTRSFRVPAVTGHFWTNTQSLTTLGHEGINVGAAGVLIGLSSIETALRISDFDADIGGGADWLASRSGDEHAHGLFTGNAGVAVALGLVGRRQKRPDLARAARDRLECAVAGCQDELDLFSGAAGVLWAGCLLSSVVGERWPLDVVRAHADRLHETVEIVDGVIGWRSSALFDPERNVYLGAAHGTAGIALALARWGRAAACESSVRLAAEAFASVFDDGRTSDGANILATASGVARPAHHWCHGVAGYLWCLLQVIDLADPRPQAREWAAEAFARSAPLVDNPTYCHGLAGMLETWRMLSSVPKAGDLARRRTYEAVAVLRTLHRHDGGGTIWSSEASAVVCPDLWVGFLGPATALAMTAGGIADAVLSERWLERCASTG